MDYPEKSSLNRPCPNCGGGLFRKTVDQNQPLAVVACSGCQYTTSISAYADSVQVAIKAAAAQRKAQG